MARAFVAVALPEVVLDAVATRAAALRIAGGRVTTRDQWHVTLQFLGNGVDVEAVAGALAGFGTPGGRVVLGGGGAFARPRRATVLWLGVAEGREVLARLASEVRARLSAIGFEPDRRAFRPHVTLARTSAPADLRGAVAGLGSEAVGPAWTVDALTVYESRLGRDGARYVARARIALPGSTARC